MKYTDPDGRADFSYPFDFSDYLSPFGFAFRNDGAVKYGILVEDALNGNTYSGDIVKQVNIEAAKEVGANTLEVAADTAECISEISGDLALAASFLEPEAASTIGMVSDVSSGAEVALRFAKSKVTNSVEDKEKAKKTAVKNLGSLFVGKIVGFFAHSLPSFASDTISYISSKVYETNIEKELTNEGNE